MIGFVLALFTAYSPMCTGCSGIMFSGLPAIPSKNYLAADLRYWDIGDQIQVCFSPDTDNCKIYSIQDKGGSVKGKWRFDILLKSDKDAIQFGRKELYVREVN